MINWGAGLSHILFLTPAYPSPINPVTGIFIREHARAISLYHQVTVVHFTSTNQGNLTVNLIDDESLHLYRVTYPLPLISYTNLFNRWKALRSIYTDLKASGSPADLIHANIYTSSDLAYFVSRLDNLPVVLTEHSSAFPRNLVRGVRVMYYRFFMNRLNAILPVSQDLKMHLQRYKIQNTYQTISNTVDINRFHPGLSRIKNHDSKRILCVAMLFPVKGIHFLLHAFARLSEHLNKCTLWIVGEGPERQSLEELTRQLALQDRVIFWGLKDQDEISQMMREADTFVLTSKWETQSVSAIESMASGLAVVAPRTGGLPEIIQSFCGELFEPGNIADLVEKLRLVLDNEGKYPPEQISTYASREFSHASIGQKFSNIYSRVLEEFKQQNGDN